MNLRDGPRSRGPTIACFINALCPCARALFWTEQLQEPCWRTRLPISNAFSARTGPASSRHIVVRRYSAHFTAGFQTPTIFTIW